MGRKKNKVKPWAHLDDVVHLSDGGFYGKLRYTKEEAELFLSSQSMFGLEKDEKGYYHISGELVCTID